MDNRHILNVYYVTTLVLLVVSQKTFAAGDWRLDGRYEPWTMHGKFILGTPPTCDKAPAPENGRWVCSYGMGENGRSLCLVDCQKDYVIEGKPLIFNCNNGVWNHFPTPFGIVDMPYGRCVKMTSFTGVDQAEKKSIMDFDFDFL